MAALKQTAFLMLIPIAYGHVQVSECYSTQCTPGWVIFRDHCYKFLPPNELTLTFDEAEDYCQGFSNPNGKGHLVSVHDQQESDFVFRLAQAAGMVWDVWIGLTDKQTEGVFKLTDGTSFSYDNWRPHEPSGGLEDCTEMIYDGTWNDVNGDSGLRQSFMCKMPSYDMHSLIGVFKWTDGSSISYDNWRSSEPSGGYLSDPNEDYTEMIYDGTWNDANGDSGLMQSFMCKMPSYDTYSFIAKGCFNCNE